MFGSAGCQGFHKIKVALEIPQLSNRDYLRDSHALMHELQNVIMQLHCLAACLLEV